MSESTLDKISRKTGKKQTNCKCQLCKSQCRHPCLGTPEDIAKLINTGYSNRLMIINWAGAQDLGVYNKDVAMVTPKLDKEKGACTFFTDGLCELHDLGLKPTEGRLSHHSTELQKFNPKKSIGWAVAKEWLNKPKEYFQKMLKGELK